MIDESLAEQQSPHIVSIHILDDDALLNVFYLYRPFFLGENEDVFNRPSLVGETQESELWDRGRWWYRLAHVCQRWRNLILHSVSYLGLSLVCTNGTPVENMLAHSPPLPLTVDYIGEDGVTSEDEEGIMLALEQRHRVRHLRLNFPVRNLLKFVMAIDEEFLILEYLILYPATKDSTASLVLPETLQTPNLRHLMLEGFTCPIRTRLHPTAVGLVALYLAVYHPSSYFQPNVLLQWISFMPQLECLTVLFTFPVHNRDVERQFTHAPIATHITLPNLRLFWFRGVTAYLEAVVCRITAPRLESLQIRLFKQLTFSVPRLPQFMSTTENLRFDNAKVMFKDKEMNVLMSLREADTYPFVVKVGCCHFDWQVSSVAQISNALGQVFSVVEHLTLGQEVHSLSSEEHNNLDRIEWRNLLMSFSNVKTLRIQYGLVNELSNCLNCLGLDDRELLELLPELQELTYFGGHGDEFTSFIDARQNASRPVTQVHIQSNECPVCRMKFSRMQDRRRHLESYLPHSILCPIHDCTWTGRRQWYFREHWRRKHSEGGRVPEQDANEIYDSRDFANAIADGIPVDEVGRYAFAKVQEGFGRLGKPYTWPNALGRSRDLRNWICTIPSRQLE